MMNAQKQTKLQSVLVSLETQADSSGYRDEYWQAVGLCLVVWSGGGIPASNFNPHANTHLMPLYGAFLSIGMPLREAVDAKIFGGAA